MLKAELNIDTQELVKEITLEVVKAIKPLLDKGKAEADTLLTVEDLAKYLHVTPQWIYKRTQFKEIPYMKIGRFVMFKKSEIDLWLERQKTPAINPLSSLKIIK